jgi:hypothetical protein
VELVTKRLKSVVKLAVFALCVALFLRTLLRADLSHTVSILGSWGPWIVFLVIPNAIAQGIDTEGWRRILARLAPPVPRHKLYPVRVAMEAMTLSLPAGVVVAESMAPKLLLSQGNVPPPATLAAAGARRWLTMRAHTLYVLLGAAAGAWVIHEHPTTLGGLWYGPLVVCASALLPLGASLALSLTLGSGSRVAGLHRLLLRIPIASLQRWLASRKDAFSRTDAGFSALARDGRALLAPTALFLAAWLMESVEAFIMLRVAGASLSLVEVLSFEAGLSVLRSAWFFAPAGLGALDLGYMAVLQALAVPDAGAVGAAFLVLKRGRELTWVALGWAWMGLHRIYPRRPSAAPATTGASVTSDTSLASAYKSADRSSALSRMSAEVPAAISALPSTPPPWTR